MQLGLIGLGKMGANMAERLRLAGHQVVGFDFSADAVAKLTKDGGLGVSSLEDLVQNLKGRRAVWIMVPQGKPVDDTLEKLEALISPNDILIDGGNSYYKDTLRHYKEVTAKGFQFVDVGTSGGIWGLKEGYSMMVGGDKDPVEYLRPIFEALAPAKDKGWGHVGPAGAGHFVKMVHNGIEYGMMQAYAEGFTVMEKKEDFHLDLPQIAQIAIRSAGGTTVPAQSAGDRDRRRFDRQHVRGCAHGVRKGDCSRACRSIDQGQWGQGRRIELRTRSPGRGVLCGHRCGHGDCRRCDRQAHPAFCRHLLQIPARLTRSARQWTLRMPSRWPWQTEFTTVLNAIRELPALT